MTFKGNGIIWNPVKNKVLVDFNKDSEYETDEPAEIELLKLSGQAHVANKQEETEDENDGEAIKLSKKDVMEILKERGIDFNPRDKKEVLESLMYQE